MNAADMTRQLANGRQASNAVEELVSSDSHGRWVHEFEVRGRRFTMRPGGCASFYDGRATFAAWNSAGKPMNVTVRESDAIRVISRKSTVELYPTTVGAL